RARRRAWHGRPRRARRVDRGGRSHHPRRSGAAGLVSLIRAVDLHVHLPLKEWLDGSMGPYRDGAARYFRSDVHERTVDEFAVEFPQEQVFGILLAWDAETAAHRPPVSNDSVAGVVRRTATSEPSAQRIKVNPTRPTQPDSVAARFPGLPISAAHFGWPWHTELIAMALHTTNIYIELSGWSPRYYPEELVREIGGRNQ